MQYPLLLSFWHLCFSQDATQLASRCLKRALERGAARKSAVRIAASVLTKAAVEKGSKDNVTVLIIDLKPPQSGGGPPTRHQPGSTAEGLEDGDGLPNLRGSPTQGASASPSVDLKRPASRELDHDMKVGG